MSPKKVDLPIQIEKEDLIRPSKPALKWLLYSAAVVVFIIAIVYAFSLGFSYYMIYHLSIEKEKQYFGTLMIDDIDTTLDLSIFDDKRILREFEGYDIYITDDETENAFASLGANISITTGLLESIETKEELLFILGHERQHILNRDVMRSMTKELPLTTVLAAIGLDPEIGGISATKLYSSYISRDAETKADLGGIELLNSLELNTACAIDFFKRNGNSFEKYIEFSSSHPESKKRLQNIQEASMYPDKPCTKLDTSIRESIDN